MKLAEFFVSYQQTLKSLNKVLIVITLFCFSYGNPPAGFLHSFTSHPHRGMHC
jgi:hypothetical protein